LRLFLPLFLVFKLIKEGEYSEFFTFDWSGCLRNDLLTGNSVICSPD